MKVAKAGIACNPKMTAFATASVLAFGLTGCSLLPPPITQASPKAKTVKKMEKKLAGTDTVYVMPTWVEYEKRNMRFGLFTPADSAEVSRIGKRADEWLCEGIRRELAKEPILLTDPVEQVRVLNDSSLFHFQLHIDGFSRTPTRRFLADLKSFVLMIPLFGYNLNSPLNTSSDVRLYLKRGGKKAKVVLKQIDQDDLNPADEEDLQWQVRKVLDPGYRGS